MDISALKEIFSVGETIAVEFKRCGNRIENDTYETVCSFLNRFGGDIFMGVLDDGTVEGVNAKVAPELVKNFIKCTSNQQLFTPTIYLVPEILEYDGRTIIHVHVPMSAEVHSYKKVIYDRVDDADVRVTSTDQIAQMYIRKQDIFTERRIYPYVEKEDLRLDMLSRLRVMAMNNTMTGTHPWTDLTDDELLRSANLYGTDRMTGQKGFNMAAVLLLGKDDVIMDILPAYVTDAILRVRDVDRYDDREIIKTNLIDSYERLMDFGRKHLPDKFFLENDQRKSLREIITREMIANVLIHREFTSSYPAKFIIERDRMYVENASRSVSNGIITPDNLEPNPKNPIIASFFRNIGYADQLGSGVRNLFKYSTYYSGKEPEFKEGDIFRIIVPLDADMDGETTQGGGQGRGQGNTQANNDTPQGATQAPQDTTQANNDTPQGATQANNDTPQGATQAPQDTTQGDVKLSAIEIGIIDQMRINPSVSQSKIAENLDCKVDQIKYYVKRLKDKGILSREGSQQKGHWVVNPDIEDR